MRSIKIKVRAVLFLLGLSVAIAYFNRSGPTVVATAAGAHSAREREIATHHADKTVNEIHQVAEFDSTSKVIANCLPTLNAPLNPADPLTDLTRKLRSSPTAKSRLDVENFHIQKPDGSELRLMIAPADSTEFRGLEAKLYSVDSEGLPVPESLPTEINPRDIANSKKHFLGLGNLNFHEMTLTFRDVANNVSGRLTYNLGHVSQAEVYQHGRVLGCSKSSSTNEVRCKCL